MPTYLQKHNYGLSDFQTPFQFSNRTSLPYFVWLAAHPPLQDRFNTYMQANRLGKSFWASWFPVCDRLLADLDTSSDREIAFLVDVGGNTGYDLLRLQESLREQSRELVDIIGVAGRLVLQDLPEVIDSIEGDKLRELDALGVEKQKYNFFTPQPIRGTSPPSERRCPPRSYIYTL